ncbi:hypothetical protein VTK56DRAFT_6043 [Thermocarpiscus australiensis]
MMFAVGPSIDLNSDDLNTRIQRHIGYGQFTVDLVRPWARWVSASARRRPTRAQARRCSERASEATASAGRRHTASCLSARAVAIARFATLAAWLPSNRRRRRAAWLYAFSASWYCAFVLGAMVASVLVSQEHVVTQRIHQLLGLLTIAVMAAVFIWGIALALIKGAAQMRGQEPPESMPLVGTIHRWIGRLVRALLLVNNGLDPKLSEHTTIVKLGYVALAGPMVVFFAPLYGTVASGSALSSGDPRRKRAGASEHL